MNKTILKEYQGCRKAIADYENQIQELEAKLNSLKQHELVKGSDTEHPFRYHYISVRGIPLDCEEAVEIRDTLVRMKIRRREKLVKWKILIEKVEDFINSIDDPIIAYILNLRYVKDMSWLKIALKLGGGNTEDGVRKIHDRFLKKIGE